MDELNEILNSIKYENKEKFEIIVNMYQQKMYKYCYSMLNSHEQAKDTVQDIFINVYTNLKSYKENISFNGWIYRIAHNICINKIKRNNIIKFVPFSIIKHNKISNNKCNLDLNEPFFSAINKLNKTDKAILFLKVIEDYKHSEISIILKMKETTIRKRFERLKKKLANDLNKNEEVFTDGRLSNH